MKKAVIANPAGQSGREQYNPQYERQLVSLFEPFMNLERKPDRHYSPEEYSLRRMDGLAAAAGNPERELEIIHIAGTKGKSSTALFLGAMLSSRGYGCGVFTSPHLLTLRERFLVDNRLLPYKTLIQVAEKLVKSIREQGLKANFFELMTVLALRLFVLRDCRYAVLETGIGGLLDATNYIRSPCCMIITAISFDHTELLGHTITAIASQKAGIIKPGAPVVIGPQPWPDEALPVIEKVAAANRATIHLARPEEASDYEGAKRLPPVLKENFATALAAARLIGSQPDPSTFSPPSLPGRCQLLRSRPLVVVDGAHNSDSARRLVESMHALYPQAEFTVIIGVAKGKDCRGILQELSRLPGSDFILTNPRPGKESALASLIEAARQTGLQFRINEAIMSFDQLPRHRNLLFTGSFFTALIGAELSRQSSS